MLVRRPSSPSLQSFQLAPVHLNSFVTFDPAPCLPVHCLCSIMASWASWLMRLTPWCQ